MKVLIVEDEPLAAERLKLLLGAFDPGIEVMDVLDSISGTRDWLSQKPTPDIIFLDIELADGRGFQILPFISQDCPIIFTTAYDNFALDAFQHFSVDYLLKPISSQLLARALNRYKSIRQRHTLKANTNIEAFPLVQKQYKSRFIVKIGNRMGFVETDDISYFYADGKTVLLVNREGNKYVVNFTLDKLEQMLDPCKFFRFNRKVIGHVKAISDIRSYLNNRLRICLIAGKQNDEAIISRERVQAFKEWADA
jgi:DNA-binding LytR/AlgR family response regulator